MPTSGLLYGYIELNGSGNENLNSESGIWEAERIFYGPWNDRFNFIQPFLAHSSKDPITGRITFFPAESYPDIPICRAYDVQIEGMTKSDLNLITDQIKYENAKITVKYRTPAYQSGSSPDLITDPIDQLEFNYLTEEFNTETEALYIAERGVKIEGGAATEHEGEIAPAFKVIICNTHHFITQHFLPEIGWLAIDNCQGTVNSVDFNTPSKRTFLPESSLYLGPSGFRKFTTVLLSTGMSGSVQFEKNTTWEVTHHFVHKVLKGHPNITTGEETWQKRFNADTGTWEIINLLDQTRPYYTANHRTLFQEQ